ncbi:hypothetical protein Tco_0733367 [Tanacetum coccineum]
MVQIQAKRTLGDKRGVLSARCRRQSKMLCGGWSRHSRGGGGDDIMMMMMMIRAAAAVVGGVEVAARWR